MISIDKDKQLEWTADILPGFEQAILPGLVASDGRVDIVLIRRRCNAPTKAAVLYLHGFIDYFFQTHLADFYNNQGLDFYALDLRRHGRSIRPGQLANFTTDIDEYFQDMDSAIDILRTQEQVSWLLLNGHSTGGLLAAIYGHRGQYRKHIDAIFLNSPFLDMNLPAWQAHTVEPVMAWLGKWFPYLRYPGLSPLYAQSIHADHRGQWQFKTHWKPIEGFPIYAGWIRAIHRTQAEVARGLNIECPCLVLHAQRSLRTTTWTNEALTSDIVLNIKDIQRLAPGLGQQVEIHAIPDGVHDLVLSNAIARAQVWQLLSAWLVKIRLNTTAQTT